jgi:hypothetical protein
MNLSISETAPSQSGVTPSSHVHASTQKAQPDPFDTVDLSESAQVSQLNKDGQSPSRIAQSLGITLSLVDLDLAIVPTQVTANPVAVQTTVASAPPTAIKADSSR